MKYIVEVENDELMQIHEQHGYVGHHHCKPGEFCGADLLFHNVKSATLEEENPNSAGKAQPYGENNTPKATICQELAEKIYKFIYENKDISVIDPDYLKKRLADIIAGKQ